MRDSGLKGPAAADKDVSFVNGVISYLDPTNQASYFTGEFFSSSQLRPPSIFEAVPHNAIHECTLERDAVYGADALKDPKNYQTAFSALLRLSDEKQRAIAVLASILAPSNPRRLMVDIGAGDGVIARGLVDYFEQTHAIEPNPGLMSALEKRMREGRCEHKVARYACGWHEYQGYANVQASLMLASHSLYYFPRVNWIDEAKSIVSGLERGGQAAIILSGDKGDKRRIIEHFGGTPVNIPGFIDELRDTFGPTRVSTHVYNMTCSSKSLRDIALICSIYLKDGGLNITGCELEHYLKYVVRHPHDEQGLFSISNPQTLILLQGDK